MFIKTHIYTLNIFILIRNACTLHFEKYFLNFFYTKFVKIKSLPKKYHHFNESTYFYFL